MYFTMNDIQPGMVQVGHMECEHANIHAFMAEAEERGLYVVHCGNSFTTWR
jgi:hypothetical protein